MFDIEFLVDKTSPKPGDGLPAVLIFGDGYQLFPVEKCYAIEGYARRTKFKIASLTSKSPAV